MKKIFTIAALATFVTSAAMADIGVQGERINELHHNSDGSISVVGQIDTSGKTREEVVEELANDIQDTLDGNSPAPVIDAATPLHRGGNYNPSIEDNENGIVQGIMEDAMERVNP